MVAALLVPQQVVLVAQALTATCRSLELVAVGVVATLELLPLVTVALVASPVEVVAEAV